MWGFGGILKGSALELVDGTLKLRHCTALFTTRFSPWSFGKRLSGTPVHLLDDGSNSGNRVRLTRKTRPRASSHVIPDPGHPTPRRRKRLLLPPPPFLRRIGE